MVSVSAIAKLEKDEETGRAIVYYLTTVPGNRIPSMESRRSEMAFDGIVRVLGERDLLL